MIATLTDCCPRCGYVLDRSAAPPGSSASAPPSSRTPTRTPRPRRPTAPSAAGLSAASVPKILLGLGATCLLVAAVIFLAVAWSWLGVGGRTAVLVGLTVTTALAGQWLARRDLGVAAEALTTVALGLVVLDVFGAENAGWLGTPTDESFLAIARHHPPRRLAGALRPGRTPLRSAGRRAARPRHRRARARRHDRAPPGGGGTSRCSASRRSRCWAGRSATVVLPWTSATGAGLAFAGPDRPGRHGRVRVPHLPRPLGRGPRRRDARGRRARAAAVGDRPRPRRPAAAGLRLLGLGRSPSRPWSRCSTRASPAITLVAAGVLGGLGGGGGGGPAAVVRRPEGSAGRVAAGPGPRARRARRGGPDEPGERRIPFTAGWLVPVATRRTTSRTRCCSPSLWRSWGWPPH